MEISAQYRMCQIRAAIRNTQENLVEWSSHKSIKFCPQTSKKPKKQHNQRRKDFEIINYSI